MCKCDLCGAEINAHQIGNLKEQFRVKNVKSLCDNCSSAAYKFRDAYQELQRKNLVKEMKTYFATKSKFLEG